MELKKPTHRKLSTMVLPFLLLTISFTAFAEDSICDFDWFEDVDCDAHFPCLNEENMDGKTYVIPSNVTRISSEGLRLCLEDIRIESNTEIIYVIDLSGSMSPNFNPSGDPYSKRPEALRAGFDFQIDSAAYTKAGYVGFDDGIVSGHEMSLVNVNTSEGQDSMDLIVETLIEWCEGPQGNGTRYNIALDKAIEMFDDPSIEHTDNQAIIFISDGEPNSGHAATSAQMSYFQTNEIPIYGIFLGSNMGVGLTELSTQTGGENYLVPPDETDTLANVVREIVKDLTAAFHPSLLYLSSNSATAYAIDSTYVKVDTVDWEGWRVNTDQIIPLYPGPNNVTMYAEFESALGVIIIRFDFILDVSGPPDPDCFKCRPVTKLEILDEDDQPIDTLTETSKSFYIKLTYYGFDSLSSVDVVVTTQKGDQETFSIPQSSRTEDSTVFKKLVDFSASTDPTLYQNGNLTIESNFGDIVSAYWEHPIDSRDTASNSVVVDVPPLPNATVDAIPGDTTFISFTLDITLTTNADRIYYTIDGSEPDTNDASQLYTGPITISAALTVIKAIAVGEGFVPSEIGTWTYNRIFQPATLIADPGDTMYTTESLDILLTTDEGNRIYYTIDGSEPDTNNPDQLYTGQVTVSGDLTILKAIAVGPDYRPTQKSWTYSRNLPIAMLIANPGDTIYTTEFLDILLTTDEGNRIYYTIDGTEPDTTNPDQLYTGQVTISDDEITLKAIALGSGYIPTQNSWNYIRVLPPATLIANPGDTLYTTESLDITLTTESGNRIYYTIDGTEPDTNNPDQLYVGQITISEDETILKAIAIGSAYRPTSDSWTYTRVLPPAMLIANPGDTLYTTESLDITLTTESGNRIYYTIDGTEPDTNNPDQLYTGQITISEDETILKAIAIGSAYRPTSDSWTYTRVLPPATLIANPGDTLYTTECLDITLTTDAGNRIYYTIDGTEPDTNNPDQLYTGQITISEDETILKAIAIGSAYRPTQKSWTYIRVLPFATLIASPGDTTYTTVSLDITLITDEGNRIYYTVDGSDPDTNNDLQQYTGIITINADTITIKAIAVGSSYRPTSGSWTYIRILPNATLTANPGDGTHFGLTLGVDLSTNADKIYYTIDGSKPDTNNSDHLYTGTITLSETSSDTVIINAIAVGDAFSPTSASWNYYRDRLPDVIAIPEGQEFKGSIEVSFFIDYSEAQIYYTLDGTDPDTNSPSTFLFTGDPVKITESTVLKAQAFAEDVVPSKILTEVYTRCYITTDAYYRDSNGDGRIDNAEITFDAQPDELPEKIVLTNPFNSSQKDTVTDGDNIKWFKNDPSTKKVVVTLNEQFPYSGSTDFKPANYLRILEGNFSKDPFTVKDGIAPVINKAVYYPGEVININTGERTFDTLVIDFSENVKDINYITPFKLVTDYGNTRYSLELNQIGRQEKSVIFEVIVINVVSYPLKGDSIWIDEDAGISDLLDNIQDIINNRRVEMIVKSIPITFYPTVIGPFEPGKSEIPKVIKNGMENPINNGTVIKLEPNIDISDEDIKKIKSSASIFDIVGNLVISCNGLDDKNGIFQIDIIEIDNKKNVILTWSGTNKNKRVVGMGAYLAKVFVTNPQGKKDLFKILIAVKK